MTKEELKILLRNPDQTGKAIDELECIIEEYPYFHTGHQLILKGLQHTDEKKMAVQLKKAALCVCNRDVLYHYINQSSPQTNIDPVQTEPTHPEEEKQTFDEGFTSVVDTSEKVVDITSIVIREIYSEKQLVDDLIKSAPMKTDRTETLPQNIPAKEETNVNISSSDENRRWSSGELIDFFLKANHKITPKDTQYEVDLSESLYDTQEVATELLADIYATQGHKDKAIAIYQQLILKYPEKHIYFAAQIERLNE